MGILKRLINVLLIVWTLSIMFTGFSSYEEHQLFISQAAEFNFPYKEVIPPYVGDIVAFLVGVFVVAAINYILFKKFTIWNKGE